MTATPNFASDARAGAGTGDAPASAVNAGPYVLNLCSSTTPMALAQSELPELKRFTFFVSRRFEEGRERFRLHMGYFATLAEAEEWLNVVREIYPGAWAGEAPGRKLRERAAAAAAAQAQHAAGPRPRVQPDVTPAVATRPAASPAAPLPVRVPVLQAAPAAARPAAAPIARPSSTTAPVARAPSAGAAARPLAARASNSATPITHQPAARPPSRAPAVPSRPAPPPAQPAGRSAPVTPRAPVRPVAPPAAPAAPAATAAPAASRAAATTRNVFVDSNVKEVLQALTDSSATGETRLMRAPPMPRAEPPKASLSDTQVLKLLEVRRAKSAEPVSPTADAAHGAIPLLKPDDTGTRLALKEAVNTNAPVLFAVQLQWSVQPVELDKVPPLAIFSAYTLYTVEGSRDGRKWYGLRLGFFTDAISAKQVAHYVRSEFTSVAVLPVSPQEKMRASDQDKEAAATTLDARPASPSSSQDEFKLLDDTPTVPVRPHVPPAVAGGKKIPGRPVPKVAVGRKVIPPTGAPGAAPAPRRGRGKVAAKERSVAQALEETLEILGAGQLSMDDGRGANINDSGVRHLHVEMQKNSPFSRLLDRLSERMKKP